MAQPNYQRLFDPSAEQLIAAVADRVVAAITHAWREQREAQIVITGGRTGLAIAKAIDVGLFRATSQEGSASLRDARVRIWFSDERFVAHTDEDRSDSTLIAAFEKSLGYIHFERVAEPDAITLAAAAEDYAMALETRVGKNSRFDAVIVSMGEDGHIASLFPGDVAALNSMESAISVDNSPKPPARRVSIGAARLANASAIYIFAVGESKRGPLQDLLAGKDLAPISMMRKNSPATQIYFVTDIKI
jgi:6-phosphogluconolactonase